MSKRQVYYRRCESYEDAQNGFLNDYVGIRWPGTIQGLSMVEIAIQKIGRDRFRVVRTYKRQPIGPYKITVK